MLVIRMQRTGRKGHAQFRVVVQDSRRTPTSGKIVASLGNFNPHTKEASLDKEKASFYLEHGAQPSERVVRLLKAEKVKLPSWVEAEPAKKRAIKSPEKLRRNQPKEEKVEEPAEEKPEEIAEEASEARSSTSSEADGAEAPTEEPATEEAPAEEAAPEAEAPAEETAETTEDKA